MDHLIQFIFQPNVTGLDATECEQINLTPAVPSCGTLLLKNNARSCQFKCPTTGKCTIIISWCPLQISAFDIIASFIPSNMMIPSRNPALCALCPLSETESNMAALHHQFSHHNGCAHSDCLESEIMWQQFKRYDYPPITMRHCRQCFHM